MIKNHYLSHLRSGRGIVYIGLGANLPSPAGFALHTLRVVRVNLQRIGATPLKSARLYRTEPIGQNVGGVFTNSVLMCQILSKAESLLCRLQKIERLYGCRRANLARPLDLDILDMRPRPTRHYDFCEIPHPRMQYRRFVLEPLCELAPNHPIKNHAARFWRIHARGAVFPLRSARRYAMRGLFSK